jgi:tetraacyldisaccharide 4'-kinase
MKKFLYSIASGERRDLIAWTTRIPLFLISLVYALAVRIILAAYASGVVRRKHLSVPVISVGNLTLGGVGKTPMVIYIVRMLQAKGLKPVVLTRGYMPSGHEDYVSDEAQVLRQALAGVPVVVNPDRYVGGLAAIDRYHPDVVILDDGFQHWKLFRNLDIVLIDAVNPLGNGHLLPCGILREPFSSLKRADCLVMTKADQADTHELRVQLQAANPKAPLIETLHRPKGLLNIFTGNLVQLAKLSQPAVAFCGIGNPKSFESTLRSINANCKDLVAFADHHPYDLEDMKRLKVLCEAKNTKLLVTTQKDAVKLDVFKEFWQGYEVYSLNIEIEITQGEHEFVDRIHHLLHG